MLFADKVEKWNPDPNSDYDIKDIRKDEQCTDTVGVFVQINEGRVFFKMLLGPKVQTLTRAISSILCEVSEGESIEKIQAIEKMAISRIVGQELVRLRSQTVYYILERMKDTLEQIKSDQ
jgi:cysteine desulfuration protein SufE